MNERVLSTDELERIALAFRTHGCLPGEPTLEASWRLIASVTRDAHARRVHARMRDGRIALGRRLVRGMRHALG